MVPLNKLMLLLMLVPAPSAAPVGITASAVDARTLLVSWTPPPPGSWNGIIREYVVNVLTQETGQQFQLSTTGSASSLRVGGLHPDYTYTYTVGAGTAVGTGSLSESHSIRMPEEGKNCLSYLGLSVPVFSTHSCLESAA